MQMPRNSFGVMGIVLAGLFAAEGASAQASAPAARPVAAPPAPPVAALPAPPTAGGAGLETDKFIGVRETADRLSALYEKYKKDNLPRIDKMLKSKTCKMPAVESLLTQIEDAYHLWNETETKYWVLTAQSEERRVESQEKSLADMEVDKQHAADLVVSTGSDRDKLIQRKETIEKDGKRTEEIRKQMDELIQDIKVTEGRLAEAQKNFEDASSRLEAARASINAKLVEYRRNKQSFEADRGQVDADYEAIRAEAEKVCK